MSNYIDISLISLPIAGGIAAGIVAFIIAIIFIRSRRRVNVLKNMTLLSVRVPKATEEQQKEGPIKQINLTEQLFSALASIKESIIFEVSVTHTSESISFYLTVPKQYTDFAQRQIQGLFPDAKVDEVQDYNIFGHNSAASSAFLTLGDSYILPIRTYKEAEVDTFAPIISTFSKLREVGEGASLQIVMKPADESYKKLVTYGIEELKKGVPLKKVLKLGAVSFGEIGKEFAKEVKKFVFPEAVKEEKDKIVDDEAVKALQAKISKQLFDVNVRIATSGQSQDSAEDILLSIAGSFAQFGAPVRNELKMVKTDKRNFKKSFLDFSFENFNSLQ